MKTCPLCRGRKYSVVFVDGERNGRRCGWQERRPCATCGGTGEVTDAQVEAHEAGQRLREDRRARHLTLQQEAERLGITPIELHVLRMPLDELDAARVLVRLR